MKKLISCLLAATVMLTLAACSKNEDGTATNTDATGTTAAIDGMTVAVGLDENGNVITEIVPTTKFKGTTDPMSEVTVVIPYNYVYSLDQKYQNDLQLFCTDNGFTSYTADEEGGKLTFKMTATAYNAFLSAKRWELSQIFYSLINTYPFFDQCIANNMEYTDISIRVDRKAYESDPSASVIIEYVSSLCMNSYQIFLTTTDYRCHVKIVDKDTGDIIEEFDRTSVFSN